ncbi:MAG: efflux RND transporter periplasmic adaptor subunit [Alphaproteobacteria bacterium]
MATAGPADFLSDIAAVGRVEPDTAYVLAFKTPGVIARLAVEEGDTVHKGEVLAELDPRDVDALLRQAQEAADKAARDFARVRQLHAKGFASDAALQDAAANAKATRASADAARSTRGYATITAPSDGVVLKRHAETNAVIAAGAPVLTLSDMSEAFVLTAGLADRDAMRVALGDRAGIVFDAFPGRTFDATISEIGADADPRTGTFVVKLRLAAAPDTLKSGLVGHATIRPAHQGAVALAVPVDALLEAHGSEAFVFVVDPSSGVALRRRVRLGRLSDGFVAVAAGLETGEQVVIDGAGYLSDGDKVTIATASAAGT